LAKMITVDEAVALIPDGAVIMFGGFMGCGNAHRIIDALSKSGKGNFTMISNDASMPGGPLGEEYYGVAKLIHNRQVAHLIATHVGLNPEVAAQMKVGTLKVDLIPQGSLAEMIRSGGAGLGGILTPTGFGTMVQEYQDYVHSVQEIGGKKYLLMKAMHADFAVINGNQIDKCGNVWYRGTTRNFNQVMATAATVVIAEADRVVEPGEIEPENVMTPGAYVDYVVNGGAS